MNDFDFIIAGTGTGSGAALWRMTQQFPFSTFLALDAGPNLNKEERREEFLQLDADDRLTRTWGFSTEPFQSNYSTDPASPYFGSGYPFRVPGTKQTIAKLFGGSSMHHGMMSLTPNAEDMDEWDYLLRDGQDTFVLPETCTWQAVGTGSGTFTIQDDDPGGPPFATAEALENLLSQGLDVWISPGDNPKTAPPFQVVSAVSATGVITLNESPIETFGGGATLDTFICSQWNRGRMMQVNQRTETDIDNNAVGGNPDGVDAAIHGTDGPLMVGRIGRRYSDVAGNPATPWQDHRPGVVVPRQSETQLHVVDSLHNSLATKPGTPPIDDGGGGTTLPYGGDHNDWQDHDPGAAPGSPWGRTWQIPLDYVGTTSGGDVVAAGHQVGALFRYDKYSERQGTLEKAIAEAELLRILDTTIAVPVTTSPGEFTVGQTVTGPSGTGTVTAVDQRLQTITTTTAGFATATAGTTITDLAAKSAVLVADAQIEAGTGNVKMRVAVDAGTVPFVAGDVIDDTVNNGVAATARSVSQQIQYSVVAGQIESGDAISTPSVDAQAASAPVAQVTTVDLAIIDKLLTKVESNVYDVMFLSTVGGVPTIGQGFTGDISGAAATVDEVVTITGTGQVFTRVTVTTPGTSFILGEPVSGSGGWGGSAPAISKLTEVQRAYGVQYLRKDGSGLLQTHQPEAPNIVLGAGPIGTPAILQRSGICAEERCGPVGIGQTLDLPGVGDRAIQHAIGAASVFLLNSTKATDYLTFNLQMMASYRQSFSRAGLGWEVGANNPSGPVLFDDQESVYMIILNAGNGLETGFASLAGAYGLSAKQNNAGPQINSHIGFASGQGKIFIAAPAMYKPRSRGGGVFLRSDDPEQVPRIEEGLLADWRSKDAECMLEAMDNIINKLQDGTVPGGFAANDLLFSIATVPPGSGLTAARVNDIVQSTGSAFHIVGTCGMGSPVDPLSVCDERGSIRHMLGVRIADTSIFPTHVRANPAHPAWIAGVNVAEMIAEDGGC